MRTLCNVTLVLSKCKIYGCSAQCRVKVFGGHMHHNYGPLPVIVKFGSDESDVK